jgi:UDP-N-acetylmuramoylalanine--D-glutamate ligase
MQPQGGHAIIATDDAWTRAALDRVPEHVRVHPVSQGDIAAHDQSRWPGLQGPHNAQNIACAVAAARLLNVSETAIEMALRGFRPLAHRMQEVAAVGGVRFVNDSKATNPSSAAPALASYSGIHWIVGGQAKSADLDACLPYLHHVRAAYVIGAHTEAFAAILAPHVPVVVAGTLAQAVADAAAAAVPGDTVLLSPAAASYDQFANFEERGAAFVAAVAGLAAREHA